MVQGVVVQITTLAPIRSAAARLWSAPAQSSSSPSAMGASPPDTTGKGTQIVWLLWSWYSTSASASAVFSTGDHMTGFEPW